VKKLAGGLAVVAAMALAAGPVGAAQPYQLPKAPGKYCAAAGFSKKKPKGTKGKTPFAQCVVAVAQVNKNNRVAPAKACKALSKKKVKGMKRTPFSACLTAVKKAKNDLS
jgi:hypothetical protein